jgi:toxin ParE1/3/4
LLRGGMGSFRLSARARAQVHEIYDYSAATFGTYQANAYHAGLERTFGLLADFPRIGQLVEELALGHRRFRFQAHHIFYTEDGDHIVIRAIYHHSRAIRPELFN